MSQTVIVLRGGDLGPGQTCMFRCNLSQASAPLEVDWCNNNGPSGWESTQFQCADCRHTTDGLIELAMRIAAQGVEVDPEEFDCDWDDADNLDWQDQHRLGLLPDSVGEICEVLEYHGDRFTGANTLDEANGWLENGFHDSDEVSDWCEIGCWDAPTAGTWRSVGLTPARVKAAAEKLVADLEDPAEEYTDGCPIYSTCNGDTDTDVIVYACIKSPNARRTDRRTAGDNLRIYDLEPFASDLWCVAGPDDLDARFVDPEDLPAGCRWISDDEWQAAVAC